MTCIHGMTSGTCGVCPVNVSSRLPCVPFPENATYKTIGLAPCPQCRTLDCWLHYLRWEISAGITLNVQHHHLVKALTWIHIGITWRDFKGEHALCKPGVLLEVEEGGVTTRSLIGDINDLGGVCDDCHIGYSAIIHRALDLRPLIERVDTPKVDDVAPPHTCKYCERLDCDTDCSFADRHNGTTRRTAAEWRAIGRAQ